MESISENIIRQKTELHELGITSDRVLLQKLGITSDEDKHLLFKWIEYQCSYAYRDGHQRGQDEIYDRLQSFIKPSQK